MPCGSDSWLFYFMPSSNRVSEIPTRHPERRLGRETTHVPAQAQAGFLEVTETTIGIRHLPIRRLIKMQLHKAGGNQVSGLEHFLADWRTMYGTGPIQTRIRDLNDRAMTGNVFVHNPSLPSLGLLIRGRRDEMKTMIGEKAAQMLGK
jgi:hypothetical protein